MPLSEHGLRFQPVLPGNIPGGADGMLVIQNEVAIISRWGELHDELTGRCFVEAACAEVTPMVQGTFAKFRESGGRGTERQSFTPLIHG